MNTESLNEHLAREGMGWECLRFSPIHDGFHYKTPQGKMYYDDWNPCENIEQAFMVLEKFEDWTVAKIQPSGDYGCLIGDFNSDCRKRNKSLPLAISLAAARATGWTE